MTTLEFQNYNKWLDIPYTEKNSLSIIVTTFHTVDYTIKLLESLKENILKIPNIFTEVLVYEDHRENDLLQKYIENIDLKNWHYFAVPEDKSTNNSVYGRMEGIKKATGKYITFLDGEDLLTDKTWQCYTKGIELLERNKNTVMAMFNVACILEKNRNNFKDFLEAQFFIEEKNITNNYTIGIDNRYYTHKPYWIWNEIFKSEFIKTLKIYNCLNEDKALNIQGFLGSNRINYIKTIGYIHFYGSENHLVNQHRLAKKNFTDSRLLEIIETRQFIKDYQNQVGIHKSRCLKILFNQQKEASLDWGIMSLGSNCIDVLLVDDLRFRGPLDNLKGLEGFQGISNIFENQLEKIFFQDKYNRLPNIQLEDNDSFLKEKGYVNIKTVFGNHYEMIYNDFENIEVQKELKHRIQILKKYLNTIQEEPGHFLVYCLGEGDFKKNIFDKKSFEKGLQILKNNNLLNKIIFINSKTPTIEDYNFSAFEYIKSLNLNTIEVGIYNYTKFPNKKELMIKNQNIFKNYLNRLVFNKNNKITIITASFENNNYLQKDRYQTCIKSWQKLKRNIECKGYDCEIKIFDYDSDILKEFNETIRSKLPNSKKYIIKYYADVFKVWYLSKYINTIWLDCDFLIDDKMDFDPENPWIHRAFGDIYNCKETKIFKEILERYLSGEFLGQKDCFVIDTLLKENKYVNLIKTKPNHYPWFIHTGLVFDHIKSWKNYSLEETKDSYIFHWEKENTYTVLKNSNYGNFIKEFKNEL